MSLIVVPIESVYRYATSY